MHTQIVYVLNHLFIAIRICTVLLYSELYILNHCYTHILYGNSYMFQTRKYYFPIQPIYVE